ncbi:hypothetical protein, partial [Klebsiella pneumoniae]
WSTSKTPSYTKSVSWQHHLSPLSTFNSFIKFALLEATILFKNCEHLSKSSSVTLENAEIE